MPNLREEQVDFIYEALSRPVDVGNGKPSVSTWPHMESPATFVTRQNLPSNWLGRLVKDVVNQEHLDMIG